MKIVSSIGLLVLASAAGIANAQISQVSYGSLTGTGFEAFEGFAGGSAPGTNYDGPVSNASVTFGESFNGQTVGANGNFDVLSGSPTDPLNIHLGIAGQNLNIFTYDAVNNNILTGLGNLGFPNFDAIGEGCLAFRFNDDQAEFGFQLLGGDGGSANVSFFKRDGSLIQSITLSGLTSNFYGFSRDGGLQDIAGVSIDNNDVAGIGLDNLRFTVPAPSAASLIGLGALAAMRRRR